MAHPSEPTFTATCQYCAEPVWNRIVVPPSIHPDQQLFVCEAHGDFIESVGLTIEAVALGFMDDPFPD